MCQSRDHGGKAVFVPPPNQTRGSSSYPHESLIPLTNSDVTFFTLSNANAPLRINGRRARLHRTAGGLRVPLLPEGAPLPGGRSRRCSCAPRPWSGRAGAAERSGRCSRLRQSSRCPSPLLPTAPPREARACLPATELFLIPQTGVAVQRRIGCEYCHISTRMSVYVSDVCRNSCKSSIKSPCHPPPVRPLVLLPPCQEQCQDAVGHRLEHRLRLQPSRMPSRGGRGAFGPHGRSQRFPKRHLLGRGPQPPPQGAVWRQSAH